MFLNYFDILVLKIIFKIIYYFNVLSRKKIIWKTIIIILKYPKNNNQKNKIMEKTLF